MFLPQAQQQRDAIKSILQSILLALKIRALDPVETGQRLSPFPSNVDSFIRSLGQKFVKAVTNSSNFDAFYVHCYKTFGPAIQLISKILRMKWGILSSILS